MRSRPCHFVVLAAGEGTRMKSSLPKVMHAVAGLPMLGHVVDAVRRYDPAASLAVVVGPQMSTVEALVRERCPQATLHLQTERRGTAHAVLAARTSIPTDRDVIVLYGDAPLILPDSLDRLRRLVADGADLAVLGFDAADPTGYGRLILDSDRLVAIREHRDASDEERRITLCNSGIMAFRAGLLPGLLDAIGTANAQGEHYLTDAVELAVARGLTTVAARAAEDEVQGVNTRAQLAAVEAVMQDRLRAAAMAGGATLIAPQTVFLCVDTEIGRDVVIEPHVVFGPRVRVADGATIRAFSHLEGASVGSGAIVGPFARLRPGASIAEGAHIGNFVEIKASDIGPGAKVNHLTYIGDASVGARANIGAGTITCNYDGYGKYRTTIGEGAFIGSNSALVAPVTIGARAYVASGSVVTENVAPDALAIARGRQSEKPGWAAAFRKRRSGAGDKPGGSGS
jgi:bifunctional UDP-N-acetylglucosamine pyrophosphorylase/glucosamine-1-phosphate N-acetyltransferase